MHSILRILLICFCAFTTATGLPSVLASDLSISSNEIAHDIEDNQPDNEEELDAGLLGLLCPSVTGEGDTEIVCCLSGVVRLGGEAIRGAEVTIITEDNKSYPIRTDKQDGQLGNNPYYQIGLPGIEPGHVLTITARYGDRERTEKYTAKSGRQRVDIVLSGTNPERGYTLKNTLWGQGDSGLLQGPHGIKINSREHVYVVDRQNQRIQAFDQTGQPVILDNGTNTWGRLGNGEGEFFTPFGIAMDSSDNVYVADTGNHRIQKFSAQGEFLVEWGSFGSAPGQFYRPEGITIDSEGYIYIADSGNYRIQRFLPYSQDLDTDFGDRGSIGTIGSGEGEFRYPTALAIDSQENLYVTDYQNHRVQKFDRAGNFLIEFGSKGECGGSGGCQAGGFDLPDGIVIDDEDNVYVSDTNHRIQKFDSQGNWQSEFGNRGTTDGRFMFPKGLAIDKEGYLYVADESNNRIQKFNQRFIFETTLGDQGENPDQLVEPSGMAVDDQGRLYIADSEENRIQIFDSKGQRTHNIGDDSDSIQLDEPQDVAIDKAGNIYIVESGSHRIQKLDSSGKSLHSWGDKGNEDGAFHTPVALAIDQDDNIYVVDKYNHRIQKFDSQGNYILKFGGGSIGGSIAEGKFNAPNDIAIGPNNTVYVADTANDRIQIFTAQGKHQQTLGQNGGENGEFSEVTGIDVDENGNIYAVDNTTRIQKFDARGQHLVTWGKASIRNNGSEAAPRFNQLTCLQSDCNLRLRLGNDDSVYVTDPENNRVQIFVAEATDRPPTVWINWLDNSVLEYNSILQIDAMTTDEDTKIEWVSDIDGYLTDAKKLRIPVEKLTVGTHVISVSTLDGDNKHTSDSETLYIPGPPEEDVVWTLLLYFSADYNDGGQLETRFSNVVQKLKENFNNPAVRIAIQLDGRGKSDTRRILLEPGDLPKVTEQPKSEANMDDPDELADFIRWGQSEFPAENYYLSIANHGQAIQGISWDNASRSEYSNPSSLRLTVKEVRNALDQPNVAPITLLHLDACSMNLVETAYEFKDKIEILISSQWLGWDYFDYVAYVNSFGENVDPKTAAGEIIEAYSRRVQQGYPYTISALNISNSGIVLEALDNLAAELAAYIGSDTNKRQIIEQIREGTQTFDSDGNYENTPTDMYVDLIVWARKLHEELDAPAVQTKAEALISILEGQFILFNEANSGNLPEKFQGIHVNNVVASGISIFYPINQRNILFKRYIEDEFFSFTKAQINQNWPRFLGVASEPCIPAAGCVHENPPPPLPPVPGITGPEVTLTPSPTVEIDPTTSTNIPTSSATRIPTNDTVTPTPMPTSPEVSSPVETATPTATETLTPPDTPHPCNQEQAGGTTCPEWDIMIYLPVIQQ